MKINITLKNRTTILNEKKIIDANIKLTEMSGLSDKDFIAAFIKMLQ